MLTYLSSFFSSAEYVPHAICLLWQPQIMALHAGSDAIIGLSYFSIPFALAYFVLKRGDLVFPGLFMLSGAFILACGATHFMSIVTLWIPDYWLEGVIKAITALVSVAAAAAMWKAMPLALALPSAAQLEQANRTLAQEIAERELAQAALRDMNAELERRVNSRTSQLQEEISQRKRSEDALRQSEMYLAEAQRISQTGSFCWRVADGTIIWSHETYRIFEFEFSANITLELMLQRMHPDDRTSARQFLERAALEERDWQLEHRLLMVDGSIKYLNAMARATKDASGRLEFLGAVMDVTAARHAEQGLREMQVQLSHANRIATIGQLTASIAHEVTQPIAAALNDVRTAMNYLNRASPDVDEAREALVYCQDDINRAADIIDRIRRHIKKAPLQKQPIDLNVAITEAIALRARVELEKNKISLEVRLGEALPRVRADRVELQQVILNLVQNAVDAMKAVSEGRKELQISANQGERDYVIISVSDTGPGIDADVERMFDPFYSTKSSGLGIGLSICRSIVDDHGGRLWAEANQPKGAVFRFSLPVDRSES